MMGLRALLSISFRPFFLLAALMATINPILWSLVYRGSIVLPLQSCDPMFWHAHEMLFGFSGAIIAGFLLTASANWTGSAPYRGASLAFLITLWILERVVYFLPLSNEASLLLMNLFFPAMLVMLLIKLWNFPKQKYVFVPLIFLFCVSKFIHSWGYLFSSVSAGELAPLGKGMMIGAIRFLLLLIAGRVIPFFTRRKLGNILNQVPALLNISSLVSVILLIFPWSLYGLKVIPTFILPIALISNGLRQVTWRPKRAASVPMLLILHIGVGFIELSLLVDFLSLFSTFAEETKAGLHLLMAGGMGVVAIGMMTRVSLGHTGRVIKADRPIKLAYFLIITGALARVSIPMVAPEVFTSLLGVIASLWSGGFLIFIIRFLPILCSPRADA